MSLIDAITEGFSAEELEAASLRFQHSERMRDILASLDDHDDAAIGKMVREGMAAAMQERREYRRNVDNLRTWVGLNTPAAAHGAAEEEEGDRWDGLS